MSEPMEPPQKKTRPDRVDYEETPDVSEVHAAIKREHGEPSANVTPIPLWLTGVCGAVMVWAGTYFGIFHGGLSGNVFNEYESSPLVLFPLPQKPGSAGAGVAAAPLSLAEQGKAVYGNCVTCHQANGNGVAGQFPPLAKSEWVLGSEKRVVAIVLKGLTGPITVAGAKQTYSGNMVPWELSDKKIAAVVSYIRSQWGNTAPEVSEAKVAAARQEFAARKTQWTEAELLQIPADATLPDAAGTAPPATASAPGAPPAAVATAPATTAPAAAPTAPVETAVPTGTFDLRASIGRGRGVYMQTCMACHQMTGTGLPGAFPPLAQTEYTTGDARRMIAMLLKGVQGPIKVKNATYNSIMVPLETQFPILKDDSKLADVINYARNSFGNKDEKGVTPELVATVRKEFAARTTPWTEPELLAFPAPGAAAPATSDAPPAAPAPAADPNSAPSPAAPSPTPPNPPSPSAPPAPEQPAAPPAQP